jgi:hypothetical protein
MNSLVFEVQLVTRESRADELLTDTHFPSYFCENTVFPFQNKHTEREDDNNNKMRVFTEVRIHVQRVPRNPLKITHYGAKMKPEAGPSPCNILHKPPP